MSESEKTNDPQQSEPVLPHQESAEQPGTEDSVMQEADGTSRFVGLSRLELLDEARRRKNQGLPVRLPAWTLPGCTLRLRSTQHGTLAQYQGAQEIVIKGKLGLKERQEITPIGKLELNRRVILRAILEWVRGKCDVAGAARATEIKNGGVLFRFPRNMMMDGVVLRLRPLSHPYLSIVRHETEERLKRTFGDTLPPQCGTEIDRNMILHSVMEMVEGAEEFGIDGNDRWAVRDFVAQQWLRQPDLTEDPPIDDPEAEEAFWDEKFSVINYDIFGALKRAQMQILQANPADVLAAGKSFTVGADWESDAQKKDRPEPTMVDWTGKETGSVRALMAEYFFPPVDLDEKPPKDEKTREEWFAVTFARFNNELLNELLEGAEKVDRADPRDIVKKGDAFVIGGDDDIASNA